MSFLSGLHGRDLTPCNAETSITSLPPLPELSINRHGRENVEDTVHAYNTHILVATMRCDAMSSPAPQHAPVFMSLVSLHIFIYLVPIGFKPRVPIFLERRLEFLKWTGGWYKLLTVGLVSA